MFLKDDVQRVEKDWCLLPTRSNPKRRLKKRHEFLRIQRSGRRSRAAFIVLIAKSVKTFGRVGLTVPKNVGKAHTRNLIKRRLRHISREHLEFFEDQDLIILALPSAQTASFQELKKDVERAYEGLRSRRRTRMSRPASH